MPILFLSIVFLLAFDFATQPRLLGEQAKVPQIFFTDLLSGPAEGGPDGQGTVVTLYGSGFGRSQGASTVTLDGGPVPVYRLWSDHRIALQIGREAKSGSLIVHTAAGAVSNQVPFTVRAGRIFCAAPSGDDRRSGSCTNPWRSLSASKDRLKAGDILYAMDGLVQTDEDKYESALSIQSSGRPGAPIAIVAYPNARVTIGSFDGPRIAARTPNIDRTSDHWILAGLTFHGAMEGLDLTASSDWRIIGNDFSCPKGFGPSGCVETGQANYVAFLGNIVHDVAQPGTSKTYHAVYFSTDSNHIEVGWNTIAHVRSCRALQFHSSPLDPGTGLNQYDLVVHDNVIHDVVCDGINFATIDPSKGRVAAFNNLIYNVGTGPDPEDGSANYACIYVQGGANTGSPGSGDVEIYNNTLYHCGARANSDAGMFSLSPGSPAQHIILRDNIIVLSHAPLFSPGSVVSLLHPRGNMLWPSTRKEITAWSPEQFHLQDPLFADPGQGDFSVKDESRTQGKGAPTGLQSALNELAERTAR